ncbi:proteasome assembly chaperone 2 [[Candida] railenensis]|uniref:Proteasome assembly chaperone 2 n=1 Tax=[Candida] railenensis TaxID=45579 RepID=A0A9P0QUP8_9ASCO|nr:proteasome assembly chaperone 2 [[Candida] railenensis]
MVHTLGSYSLSEIKHSTLIIPSIAMGNIPQLTVDLLIHTLSFTKIAILDDTYLHPFSSPNDFSELVDATVTAKYGIANPLEVYYSAKDNLTLIQQRSPIINNFTEIFVDSVIYKFIEEQEFSKIILLDSSDAGLLENLTSENKVEIFTNEDLMYKSLESLKISNKSEPQSLASNDPYKYTKYIQQLIKALRPTKIELDVLVSHVYEGDNFNDAELLADQLVSRLETKDYKKWVRPISWSGAYGDKPVPNAMEQGLYG